MSFKEYVKDKAAKLWITLKRVELVVQSALLGAFKKVTEPETVQSIHDALPQITQYAGDHLGAILGGTVALLMLYVHATHTDPVK